MDWVRLKFNVKVKVQWENNKLGLGRGIGIDGEWGALDKGAAASGKVESIHLGLLEGLRWKEANASLAQCRLPLPTQQPCARKSCLASMDVIAKRESHVLCV